MSSEFSALPRRRRRSVHLTVRDMQILEDLVVRRVETIDFLHETHFGGLSRKRALNRLGDLIAAGYLKRASIELPGEALPQSVYWLTSRGQTALQLRSLAGEWFRDRSFKVELPQSSIAHQIVTNRVADWLGATVLPEHLVPLPPRRRSDKTPRQRPDAVYQAAGPDQSGANLVYLEVDLGHYNRKRIIEKVRAALSEPRVRMLLIACPVDSREGQLCRIIREHFGENIWGRVDVMTFASLQGGRAPGYPRPDETLRPIRQNLTELASELEPR